MANLTRYLLLSLLLVSLLLLFLLPPLPTVPNNHSHFSLPSTIGNLLPPPPQIAYFISDSKNDGPQIFRLLQATYHPRNHYLLHIDRRASKEQREDLSRLVGLVEVFVDADNVNVIERANYVREEGSTTLALVLHGADILSRHQRDWDWIINLDASDYPLGWLGSPNDI